MNWKKYSPWNWLKKEQDTRTNVPADRPTGLVQAVHPLDQLHQQIDQMFENSFRGFGIPSLFSKSFDDGGMGFLKPYLDIKETKKQYVVSIEMPGVDKNEVNVSIDGNTLTVSGEKKQETRCEDEDYHYIERSYGSFQRVLNLPDDVDTDDLDASFKKGVLTLKIGRMESKAQSSGRRVEIRQEDAG